MTVSIGLKMPVVLISRVINFALKEKNVIYPKMYSFEWKGSKRRLPFRRIGQKLVSSFVQLDGVQTFALQMIGAIELNCLA